MTTINLKQGEAKNLQFTCTDLSNSIVDITLATLTFTIKQNKSSTVNKVQKLDADFDKSQAGSGIAIVNLNETDTNQTPGQYYGELKVFFSGSAVEKSNDIIILIEKAVY